MKIITYNGFLNEDFFGEFKSQYQKLFNGMDEDMYRDFGEYMKRMQNEKDAANVARLYNQFLMANQATFNKKVDGVDSIEQINKLITDNVKTLYFAIKPVIYKINKDSFTMETIFGNTGIKKLMTLPEKEFANKITTDINQNIINDIMAKSGIKQNNQQGNQQQNQPQQPNQGQQNTTESVLLRILEENEPVEPVQQNQPNQQTTTQQTADDQQKQQVEQENNLKKYKNATKNWFNGLYKMVFDSSKGLIKETTQEAPISNNIDAVAKMMKNSTNIPAKTQLLMKITTLDRNQLQELGKKLGLNFEEIGNF